MNPTEANKLLKTVKPEGKLKDAFSLIIVKSYSNPSKTAKQLERDKAVRDSLDYIASWASRTSKVLTDLLKESSLSAVFKDDARQTLVSTLAGIVQDIDIANHPQWKDRHIVVRSQLQLRLNWLYEWLERIVELVTQKNVTMKTWVSRRSATTCSVCFAMHGITIPIEESFTPYIVARGGRPYANNLIASAHPRCQCRLIYS